MGLKAASCAGLHNGQCAHDSTPWPCVHHRPRRWSHINEPRRLLLPCVTVACVIRSAVSSPSCPSLPARQRGTAMRRARRDVVRCQAAREAGTIMREVLTRSERTKLNAQDDRQFYQQPRIVKHVDDRFLAQVTELYRRRVPADAVVLDLMSSWVSHLPDEVRYGRVIGHGMNAQELARNWRLDEWFVRDLNAAPDSWALATGSVDAVLVCVSVQYLQQPERVFAEVFRVLRPGGVCIVTFSNRLFYDKARAAIWSMDRLVSCSAVTFDVSAQAIQAWRDSTGFGRAQLVKSYFSAVAGFTEPEAVTQVDVQPRKSGPLDLALAALGSLWQRSQQDPFYGVMSYRNFKRQLD